MKKNIIIKKGVFTFCFFCAILMSVSFFVSCAKSSVSDVKNNAEAAKKIHGNWQRVLILDTELGIDKDNPAVASGVVRYVVTNTFEFMENGSFVSRTSQEFESYTPLNEIGKSIDEKIVESYIAGDTEIQGTYILDDMYLEYTPQTVKANGEEMSYLEYLQKTGEPAQKSFVVAYKLDDVAEGDVELVIYEGADSANSMRYVKIK